MELGSPVPPRAPSRVQAAALVRAPGKDQTQPNRSRQWVLSTSSSPAGSDLTPLSQPFTSSSVLQLQGHHPSEKDNTGRETRGVPPVLDLGALHSTSLAL